MKLKTFLSQLFVKNKTLAKQYPQILDTCLQDCLEHMFPGEGFVRFYMHDVVKDIKKVKVADIRTLFQKTDDARNLLFHIRDDAWLTEHLAYHLQRYTCPELDTLGALSKDTLQKFVATSPVFDKQRCEFEQHLVKSYISECLDYKNDDFFSRSIEKILETGSENYDKLFRCRVIDAMNFLGVNRSKIEDGLELNADLWRRDTMGLAFANRYRDLGVTYTKGRTMQIPHEDVVDTKSAYHKYVNRRNITEYYLLPRADMSKRARTIYDKWMCLREYEYYLNHKNVIDRLGTATPNMKIKQKVSKQLLYEINDLDKNNHCGICL